MNGEGGGMRGKEKDTSKGGMNDEKKEKNE